MFNMRQTTYIIFQYFLQNDLNDMNNFRIQSGKSSQILMTMRTIRTRRIKTQNTGFSIGPFHESVIQIEIDKSKKCLLEIKNNHLQRANSILKQIEKDKSIVTFENKIQIALKSLISLIKSYLCFKQSRTSQSINHLQVVQQLRNQCQRVNKMIIPLSMLIKATIQSQLGNLDKSKATMKDSLYYIKSIRNDDFLANRPRYMKMYDEVLVLFFDMIVFQIGKNIPFQQIQAIYKEGFILSQKILGKQHRLTLLMQNFLQQKSHFFSKRTDSSSSSKQKSLAIKFLNSKRKLKVNQQKLFSSLIQKSGQNIKKYNHDLAIFNKLTNPNKISKKEYSYYLKSLEKAKEIYRTQTQSNAYSFMSLERGEVAKSNPLSRNEFSRKKIKDIILRGPKLKTEMLYSKQQTEMSERNQQNYTPTDINYVRKDEEESEYIKIEKVDVIECKQQMDLKQVALIMQEGQKKKKQECQLI